MNIRKITVSLLLLCGLLTACEKDLLNQVNPNSPSADTFWKTQDDALQGLSAAYAGMQNREITTWELFILENRSDEGYSQSPWTDLSNVSKFIFNDYNIAFNLEMYRELYRNIYRCNQVLEFVPNIEMDETLKNRILAEAKFLRGHFYYKLVTIWGNVPLVDKIQSITDLPEQGSEEQVWALIMKDFSEAKAVLPETYANAVDLGRATKGAATAYLGKAYLQQKKWTEAAAQFKEIIDQVPARYDLMPSFKDNFTDQLENNKESIFEIQFANNNGKTSGFPVYDVAGGDETWERAQFLGVRGIGWCDGQPSRWLLLEFQKEKDKDGNADPRLQYTMTYKHEFSKPAGYTNAFLDKSLYVIENGTQYKESLYGKTYEERGFGEYDFFWRKYTNYWKETDSYFSAINQRVIRLADVYLMYAECLNELGRTSEAIPFANLVRARSNMNALSLTLPEATFREQLRHDRVMELAGESVRFVDMKRYGILGPELAGTNPGDSTANVASRDTEFKYFVKGKSERLPLPLYEVDANQKLDQNPGW